MWTPDGKRITFRRIESAENSIYWIPADGSGAPEKLLVVPVPLVPTSWTSDSSTLIYYQGLPMSAGTWILRLQGDNAANRPEPRLFIPKAMHAQLSPDGRWVAYVSNESGVRQIYAQPFPESGGRLQISTDGGWAPRWARSGTELFYRNGDKMMAVDVPTQTGSGFGVPKVLFTGAFAGVERALQAGIGYDVSPDGKRFLMVKSEHEQDLQDRSNTPAAGRQIEVVHNWFEELRRIAPAGK